MTGAPAGFSELIRADDWDSLVRDLEARDWRVPRARRERRNPELERWTLRRALLTAKARQLLPLPRPPFVIHQGDRPDFLVSGASGSLGIEVAEVISPAVAESLSIAEDHCISPHFLRKDSDFDTARPSEDELLEVLRNGGRRPWIGYEPEEEFLKLTSAIIRQKVEKAKGYDRADELILLLHDNSGLPLQWDCLEKSGVPGRIQDCVTRASVFTTVAILLDLGDGLDLIAFNL